jgi:transposase
MGKQIHDTKKHKEAVAKYYELKSLRKAADAVGVSKSQLHRWIQDIGVKKIVVQRQRRSKLTPDIVEAIETAENTAVITSIEVLCAVVEQKTGVCVPRSSMYRYAKVLGRKRMLLKTQETGKSNTEQREAARAAFVEGMRQFQPNEVIAIDEIGFSNRSNRIHHYTFQNRSVAKKITGRKRFNCVAAVTTGGFLTWQVERGAINTRLFKRFIQKILKRPEKCVIMDNVAFHKNAEVRKLLEAHGKTAVFIPAYQPACNPIEFAFSGIKRDYRRRLARGFSMQKCISDAFMTRRKADLRNAFCHSLGRPERVARRVRRAGRRTQPVAGLTFASLRVAHKRKRGQSVTA